MKKNWSVTISHFLLGCRFDRLMELFKENDFKIPINRWPQTLVICLFSIILFPFAVLEEAFCSVFVYPRKMKEDPIFILGHWRSGTTYMQNLMSCDPQFSYFDPITTYTNNNALFLHKPITAVQKKAVVTARPMDNLDYESDSPSEECFAVANRCTAGVVHVMAFPQNADHYIDSVVVSDKSSKIRNDWCRAYHKVMSKVSYINGGRRLVVKSPDNTCHIQEILKIYPNAKFIHIYRTPYRVVPSTVNMFELASQFLSLQDIPSHEEVEDTVINLYKKVYTQYLNDRELIPAGNLIEIKYEDFIKTPGDYLERIYTELGIQGYENARPYFEEHIAAQSNYQVSKHHPDPQLEEKIRTKLRFAFDEFGYDI